MKELENLEKRLADIQKEIETLKQGKPEFEVGDYVSVIIGGRGALCANGIFGKIIPKPKEKPKFYNGLLFEDEGTLIETFDGFVYRLNGNECKLRKLTPTEIQEALEKEAVKRGIKEGVTLERSHLPYSRMETTIDAGRRFIYYPDLDRLELNGWAIYELGQWATVIKEQPLMIGEYPVKAAIEGVTINHTFYPESSIFKIKEALEVSNIKSVNVGCNGQYKVDLEMINKIIKLIK